MPEQEREVSAEARLYTLQIFCDFDGTLSTVDIGYELFNRFAEQEPTHTDLMEGRIDIKEYWRRIARSVHTPLTDSVVQEYVRSIPADPGAHELLKLVRAEELPFTVVSDGLDLYIKPFLKEHGLGNPALFCNRAVMEREALDIEFSYAAEGCACLSAVCKRNVVLAHSPPDARIVYIGDGVSDFCPAEHADIIFAKKNLAAYCNQHKLPHYPFTTLADVAVQLRKLLARRRVRIRHQAALKRKRAWEAE